MNIFTYEKYSMGHSRVLERNGVGWEADGSLGWKSRACPSDKSIWIDSKNSNPRQRQIKSVKREKAKANQIRKKREGKNQAVTCCVDRAYHTHILLEAIVCVIIGLPTHFSLHTCLPCITHILLNWTVSVIFAQRKQFIRVNRMPYIAHTLICLTVSFVLPNHK